MINHYALTYASRLDQRRPPWSSGLTFDPIAWIDFTPLKILFCGDQAVLVFFALSGFVLALTLKAKDGWRYDKFIVKRFFRIYLPFAAAIALSALLFQVARPHPIPSLSGWFNGASWNQPLTSGIFFGHLAMTDRPSLRELDHVMWSLVVEARISLVFPLLALCVQARWFATLLVSIIISAAALAGHHYLKAPLTYDPFSTLQYLFLFTAGAVLALKAHDISRFVSGIPLPLRLGLWALTLALITYPANRHFGLFVAGAASIVLVVLCFADRKVDRHLSGQVSVWLGRISYSLYLIHVPILLFIVHTFYGHAPLLALLLLSAAASFLMAELGHRFVEIPAMKWGGYLAKGAAS